MKKIIFCFTIFIGLFSQAQILTFEEFKKQVIEKDPKTQSLQLQYEALKKTVQQSDFMTSIHFFANASLMDDQRPTVNPGFQGDRTTSNLLGVGLQQQTRYGLKWSLSQNWQKTHIENANPVAIPQSKYNDNFPKIELSMPLWRNWLGSETQGDQSQLKKQAELQFKKAEIDWMNQENEIELTYYRLLSRQETFQIQKDSLERAQKILQWSQSRYSRNLIDEGDLVQAQAAVKAREIDLITAQVDLQTTSRLFNLMRGLESDQVKETLKSSEISLQKLNLKKDQRKERLDFEIQKRQIEQQLALAKAQREKMKPSLDLQMQAWTQGRGLTYTSASENTFGDEDYLFIGLNFSMPIDQIKASQVRSGYSELIESQKRLEDSRLQQLGNNWLETVEKADQIKQQVQILRELERLQRKKADSERDKLNRGRSTTFQVLTFEQDYFNARNRRIAVELEARQFIHSLDLYR